MFNLCDNISVIPHVAMFSLYEYANSPVPKLFHHVALIST